MPTKTLSDMRLIVSGLIQDVAGKLSVTSRNQAIAAAVKLHSNNVPARKFQVVTGASNGVVRTPTGWVHDVSEILQIEYPLGRRPPEYLQEDQFRVIPMPTGSAPYKIYLTDSTPTASEPIGVRFTTPHTFGATASQNTIPDHHVDAVAHLAAHIACNQLAAFYSQSGDSGIQADSVNHQQKLPNYLQLAKAYVSHYMAFFKISEAGFVKAASVLVDIDRKTSWGDDLFYHPKRRR
jgi:hypothetical protein